MFNKTIIVMLMLLFIGTLGAFSFSIDLPDNDEIVFTGWLGKAFKAVTDA